MKISPAIISYRQATSSVLYASYLSGFTYLVRATGSVPIAFRGASFSTDQSDNTTFYDTPDVGGDVVISTSSQAGNFNLFIPVCFHVEGSPINLEGAGSVAWTAPTGTQPNTQKYYVLSSRNVGSEVLISERATHTTSVGHDHLTVISSYRASDVILADFADSFQNVEEANGTNITIPISSNQADGDMLIAGVIHHFPVKTPEGWTLDFRRSIEGVQSNVTPYLKGLTLSLYRIQVPPGLVEDPIFEIYGADNPEVI